MKRLTSILLGVILAIVTLSAHAETREEMKARLGTISKRCVEATDRALSLETLSPGCSEATVNNCFRIGSLRDNLIRCATERHHLRRAAACSHDWKGIGPKVKGCSRCESIAHFVNGEWLVVLADGIWVGPEPSDYPEDYGLKRSGGK